MYEKIIIELHYLPIVEYFLLLQKSKKVIFEINESYQKQTFRNRCLILSPNKIQNLIVPIIKTTQKSIKDTLIDNNQSWQNHHWKTISNFYSRMPFFMHFEDTFINFYKKKKFKYLIDLNFNFIKILFNILNLDKNFTFTQSYQKEYSSEYYDFRNYLNKKNYLEFKNRKIYNKDPYFQAFSKTFVPNLSIIDLIFSVGKIC